MKVGIVGGTGRMGMALAGHLSKEHDVMIGSRKKEKAASAAEVIPGTKGGSEGEVSEWCDIAILAVPFQAVGGLGALAQGLSGKVAISMVNPLRLDGKLLQYTLEKGSAAETVQSLLPQSRVATAFNSVPVAILRNPGGLQVDVLVAADSKRTFEATAQIVKSVPGMRPVYVGPLTQSESVERATVLVLNAARLAGGPGFSLRLVR